MRKTLRLFRGELRVRFRGGDPARFLNACAEAGVELREIESAQEGLYACLFEEERTRAEKIALLCSGELETLALRGGSRERGMLRRRARLAVFACLCALALSLSSLFIWDFEVTGNDRLSRTEILRALADCGVGEGCFWPAGDAEAIRSKMLLRLPELAWMSLNVRGSRASVVVLERRDAPEIYREDAPADLIAARGGVIAELSVENGRALASRGQTVTEGETLVSGTLESLAAPPRRVRARGSVTADTWPERTVVLCPAAREKSRKKGFRMILGLRVGKHRVKLLPNSRKELDECDRIVKEDQIGVKGLFTFPLRLIAEVYRPFETQGDYRPDPSAFEPRALAALGEETDGEVLSCEFTRGDGFLLLRAHCREEIALTKETENP